jgi:hypothetical protein
LVPVRQGQTAEIKLLEADPGLASVLDGVTLQNATLELRAPLLTLTRGEWNPASAPPEAGLLGVLVIDGLIARYLQVTGARCAELLGKGDLLRPWQEDATSFVRSRWRILEEAKVAPLGPGFASRLSRYPALIEALFARSMRRSRSLAVLSAIDNVVGLEERLRLLFWHLAERWGTVERDGVVMPLRLTHEVLADLVGSRRPSITTALAGLVERGAIVEHPEGGWRLIGSPPDLGA